MFDFHMHSNVSFDSEERASDMVRAARERGLREICFTDHYDHSVFYEGVEEAFDLDTYAAVYDGLTDPEVLIRRGAEFGLQPDNVDKLTWLLSARSFDLLSVRFITWASLKYTRRLFGRAKALSRPSRSILRLLLSVSAFTAISTCWDT